MIDDDKLYLLIGKNIKSIRNTRDLNQNQFGDQIGLNRTSVTNIEHGKQRVTVETLYRISECFGLDGISGLLPSLKDVQKNSAISEQKEITSGSDTKIVGEKTFLAIQRRR